MPYKIGLVGKPSVGKSTFFNAATTNSVDEGSYPFTTIDPSVGEAYARVQCAAPDFGEECDPNEGFCTGQERFVPVKLVDVAGLIPGASEGKGLGNKFLTDLNEADVLIHIVDFSGETDEEGEPTTDHDPRQDITFLKKELDKWYKEILEKGISKYSSKRQKKDSLKIEEQLAEQMSAFNTNKNEIKRILVSQNLYNKDAEKWSSDEVQDAAREIRRKTKPMIIAANKMDKAKAQENYNKITQEEEFKDETIIPLSAHAEKALRSADKQDKIEYTPGDTEFEITSELSEDQKEALNRIKDFIEEYGGTGVQKSIESALFKELGVMAVFPGGTNGLGDKHGNILPDCFLIGEGSTALDFAYELHTDLGDGFLHAVDVREERKISADQELNHRDVIEIVSSN